MSFYEWVFLFLVLKVATEIEAMVTRPSGRMGRSILFAGTSVPPTAQNLSTKIPDKTRLNVLSGGIGMIVEWPASLLQQSFRIIGI
jgi:hypothetical protein